MPEWLPSTNDFSPPRKLDSLPIFWTGAWCTSGTLYCTCGASGGVEHPFKGWEGRVLCANCGRTSHVTEILFNRYTEGYPGRVVGAIPFGPMPAAVFWAARRDTAALTHVERAIRVLTHLIDGGTRTTYANGALGIRADLDHALEVVLGHVSEMDATRVRIRNIPPAGRRHHGRRHRRLVPALGFKGQPRRRALLGRARLPVDGAPLWRGGPDGARRLELDAQ